MSLKLKVQPFPGIYIFTASQTRGGQTDRGPARGEKGRGGWVCGGGERAGQGMGQEKGHDKARGRGGRNTCSFFFFVSHLPAEAETATGASSSIREAMRRMVDVM